MVAVIRRHELWRDRGADTIAVLAERVARDGLGRVDAGEPDLGAQPAVLREDPVDQVVVVAHLRDAAHHQLHRGAPPS